MRLARRVANLPPYLFAELDKRVAQKRASGADVISLGIGDPDLPTPPHVLEALNAVVPSHTGGGVVQAGHPGSRGALWRTGRSTT